MDSPGRKLLLIGGVDRFTIEMIKRQETHTSPDRSQTPTSRGQLLQTNEDQGIGKEHFDVGCFYEVNHQNLPTRTPVQLKSNRVVLVTGKTELNVSVKYPSIGSLRNYLRRDKMSSTDTYPVLDDVFVMETHLAGKVLGRQIPTQEFNDNTEFVQFWLINNSPEPTTKLPKVELYVDLDSLSDGQSARFTIN